MIIIYLTTNQLHMSLLLLMVCENVLSQLFLHYLLEIEWINIQI